MQRLDNEVRYYFIQLPQGTHTFHFRVRRRPRARSSTPRRYAELMYRDEVRGRGEGMRIVVTGAHEK